MPRRMCSILAFWAACGFGDDRHTLLADVDGGADAQPADARPIDAAADAAIDAPPQACVLVPQSGCAGRACDIADNTGATACRDVTVAGMADDTCASVTQCAAGWSCIETNDEGSCLELCRNDIDCDPAAGSRCLLSIPVPGGTFCTQACDPGSALGCPAGWNCLIDDDPGGDATECIPAGVDDQGDPCNASSECAVGYTCVNHDNTRTCQRQCRVGVSGSCSGFAGTTCRGFTSAHIIAGAEWGVCL